MAMDKKTSQQLVGPMKRIARTFSRNWKIDVRFEGTGCFTDGKVINLPANADFMGEAAIRTMDGMLDHEMSHVSEETEAAEGKGPSPLALIKESSARSNKEAMLLNAFEDIRIETKWGARFVGIGENLGHMRKEVVATVLEKAGKDPMADAFRLLGSALICQAMGESTTWVPASLKGILANLSDIPARALKSRHAGDCQALAREVLARLKELAELPKPPPEEGAGADGKGGKAEKSKAGKPPASGKGDKAEKGEKADKAENGAKEDKGEASEGGESEGDEADAEGAGGSGDEGEGSEGPGEGSATPGEGSEAGKGSAAGEGEAGDDEAGPAPVATVKLGRGGGDLDYNIDMAKVMSTGDAKEADLGDLVRQKMTNASAKEIVRAGRHIADPRVLEFDRVTVAPVGGKAEYDTALAAIRPAVSGLRSRISAVLRSRKQVRMSGDQERGAIDAAALYAVRTGDKRVFATKTSGEEINTTIGILVDQSGSMHPKVVMARQSVIVLAETLDKLGIPFAVWGFQNGSTRFTTVAPYNRTAPMEIDVFKGFDQEFAARKTALLRIDAGGDNCDTDAVEWAALQMAARPEPRKILLVLSDGQPSCCGSDYDKMNQGLVDVVRRAEGSGIEVFGLGILSNAVEAFYSDRAVINHINDLAPTMFKMLRAYLVEGKALRPTKKLVKAE